MKLLNTKARIWVVEMLVADDRWEPTCEVGITREEALQEHSKWCEQNPADRFRVKQYVRYGKVDR